MKNAAGYKIIFAGTPDFAVPSLQALLHSHHTVQAVYTQPDRPAGRGRKLTPSPIKQVALKQQLPICQPLSLRDVEPSSLQADLMIVVAYGLLLPLPVLQAPHLGCLNVHASLLPRWRGAAPIQRAILAGDELTGVTIMQMEQGLDTGAMLHKVSTPIHTEDTSATLHDRLAELGAQALLHTLDNLTHLQREAQCAEAATYAHKIMKEEAMIDWQQSALQLHRKIRAFNPWPVATLQCNGQMVRVWQASVLSETQGTQAAGTILQASAAGIDVATGAGVLRLQKIQFPGGRVLAVQDVLNAHQAEFKVGKLL